MRVFQLLELPELLEADALYFILNGDYAESYLTDDNGVAKFIGNTSMIESLAAGGSTTVAELTDATTYDFPTLNTPVSDALAAKANSADLGSIATFEGDQNLRTTDPATFTSLTASGTVTAAGVETSGFLGTPSTNSGFYAITSYDMEYRRANNRLVYFGFNLVKMVNEVALQWTQTASMTSAVVTQLTAQTPGTVSVDTSTKGDALGTVKLANLTASGTVSAADVTATGTVTAGGNVSGNAFIPTGVISGIPATQAVGLWYGSLAMFSGGGLVSTYALGGINHSPAVKLSWNNDTSLSRISAGIIGLGTGTAGSTAGTLSLANLTASGTVTAADVTTTGTVSATDIVLGGFASSTIKGSGVGTFLGNGSTIARNGAGLITNGGFLFSPTADYNLGTSDVRILRVNGTTLGVYSNGSGTKASIELDNLTASGTVSAADGYFSESVGIGTTPAASLHVYSESSTIPVFIGRLPYKTNANSQLRQRGGFIVDVAEGGASMSFGGIGSTSGGYIQAYQTNSTGTSRPLVLNPFGGFVGIGFGYQQSPTEALDVVGNIKASGTVQTGSYTVATLPPTPSTGMRAQVTDSSVAAHGHFGTTVAAGGSNIVPVFYNGTNWIIA